MQKSKQTSSGPSQSGGTRPTVEVVKETKKVRSIAANSDLSASSFNKAARIASTAMIQNPSERRKKKVKDGRRALFRPLKPRLSDWLDLLADPWKLESPKCPITYNPMPTTSSMVARSTFINKFTVPAGSNLQIVILPGHTTPVDSDEMDGPSFHSNWQIIGNPASTNPVGPVPYVDAFSVLKPGVLGVSSIYASGTLTSGSVITDTSTAASSAIFQDSALPIVGLSKEGGHTRYRMLASGIKFANETVEMNRGGTFYSVQPTLATLPGLGNAIKDWAKFPTFYDHGLCDEKQGVVTWIPRLQDLAFYHPGVSNVSGTNRITNAAYILWYVNTTATAQTIAISSVHHWEIGGENVVSLSEPTIQVPSDKNVIAPTVSLLQDTTHTAAPAPRVAEIVATASAPFDDHRIRDIADEGANALMNILRDHVGPNLARVAGAAALAKMQQLLKS